MNSTKFDLICLICSEQALERENSKLKQQLEEKDKELAKRREKEKKGDEEEESEGAGSSESEGGDGEDESDDDRGAGREKKKKRKPTRVEKQLSQLTDTVSSLATVMKTIVPVRVFPCNRAGCTTIVSTIVS